MIFQVAIIAAERITMRDRFNLLDGLMPKAKVRRLRRLQVGPKDDYKKGARNICCHECWQATEDACVHYARSANAAY